MLVIGVDSGSPLSKARPRPSGLNMTDFQDLVKKAFYLGVGAVSYAGEQAADAGEQAIDQLSGLQKRAQELADEMIRRGEMTTEESRQWLESLSHQVQAPGANAPQDYYSGQPQAIDVQIEDEPDEAVNDLHQQVENLEGEFRRLQDDQ
jgi:polyhydroxyalkanoate synthesis regulator phasin